MVLRLGSVYGYGGDSMRINIMPNLFSKMAATGNPIKLFGGGVQWNGETTSIAAWGAEAGEDNGFKSNEIFTKRWP